MSNYYRLSMYFSIIMLLIALTLSIFSHNLTIAFLIGIVILLLILINHSLDNLVKHAQTDLLTGLYRQGILKHYYCPCIYDYLILIDIDNFKNINDNYGHNTGDEYLFKLSKILLKTFSNHQSLISREGGDEFLILLKASEKELLTLMQNLTTSNILEITLSIGITITYKKAFEEAYREADLALYKAKELGKNQFVFF